MNHPLPPGQEADEIQTLTQVVANSLAEGEDPQTLAQQLIDSGWEREDANSFVGSIHEQLIEAQSRAAGTGGGSEAKGWLMWVGAIVGINTLSWLLDWGFWIY